MKQLLDDPGRASRALPGRCEAQRAASPHHRLRRVRGTGTRIEGLIHVSEMSGPKRRCIGQDRLDSHEVEVQVLEVRSGQAPHLARLKQTMRIRGSCSSRSIRRAPTWKARSRTRPSTACSSASTAMWTGWSISPTSTGSVRRAGDRGVQKGDKVKRSCSTSTSRGAHLAWRQAARRRSVRRPGDLKRARCHHRGDRGEGLGHRREIVGYEFQPPSSSATSFARDRSEQRAERSRSAEGDARVTQFDRRPARSACPIKALEWPKRRKRSSSSARPIPARRSRDILGTALRQREKRTEGPDASQPSNPRPWPGGFSLAG